MPFSSSPSVSWTTDSPRSESLEDPFSEPSSLGSPAASPPSFLGSPPSIPNDDDDPVGDSDEVQERDELDLTPVNMGWMVQQVRGTAWDPLERPPKRRRISWKTKYLDLEKKYKALEKKYKALEKTNRRLEERLAALESLIRQRESA